MVYNMSIQKEESNKPLSPKFIRREVGDRKDKTLVTETEIEYLIVTETKL